MAFRRKRTHPKIVLFDECPEYIPRVSVVMPCDLRVLDAILDSLADGHVYHWNAYSKIR